MTDEDYYAALDELIDQTARWAAGKYDVKANGVMGLDDLKQDLFEAAWKKQDKLQPRLEAGEVGYVVKALRNAAHDALEPDWKRQAKDGGTLEDFEIVSEGSPRADGAPRTVARKSLSPTPAKIQRTAAKAADRALERMKHERAAATFIATLNATDAEIFRLHLGSWLRTGARPAAIALELDMSEATVYRRLAKIEKQAAQVLAESEPG